jgi:transcriptional regulator with XRE-family HTH domain
MRANLGTAPSLRSRWLGQAMRRLREGRGMRLRYTAEQVGVESPAAGRFERGEELFGEDRIVALLDLYFVLDQAERHRLLSLARDAWKPPIVDAFDGGSRDPSFLDLLWLEQRAERIRCYSTALVPELLQTAAYAGAVLRADRPGAEGADVERKVSALAHRQAPLHSTAPVRLQAVLSECVLHRPVGAAQILNDQVRHLAQCHELSIVDLRALPVPVGYVPGMAGPFTVFDLPAPYPTVAVVPYLGGWLLLDGRDAAPYAAAFERLYAAAATSFPSIPV